MLAFSSYDFELINKKQCLRKSQNCFDFLARLVCASKLVTPGVFWVTSLPHLTAMPWVHGRPHRALEVLCEVGRVGQSADHAVFGRTVGVCHQTLVSTFWRSDRTPHLQRTIGIYLRTNAFKNRDFVSVASWSGWVRNQTFYNKP